VIQQSWKLETYGERDEELQNLSKKFTRAGVSKAQRKYKTGKAQHTITLLWWIIHIQLVISGQMKKTIQEKKAQDS